MTLKGWWPISKGSAFIARSAWPSDNAEVASCFRSECVIYIYASVLTFTGYVFYNLMFQARELLYTTLYMIKLIPAYSKKDIQSTDRHHLKSRSYFPLLNTVLSLS